VLHHRLECWFPDLLSRRFGRREDRSAVAARKTRLDLAKERARGGARLVARVVAGSKFETELADAGKEGEAAAMEMAA
jgi:hypothetical protein